jgi:hypothetical protein
VEFFDNGSDGHIIDDFSFGTVSPVRAVPEPSTLILLGSSMAGLIALRRKVAV